MMARNSMVSHHTGSSPLQRSSANQTSSRLSGGQMSADGRPKLTDDRVSFTDLFFWALASGQPQLVQILWSRVAEPLRCAVVGVEACRRISKKYFSRGRGKASAKRLLASIEARLEDGLVVRTRTP